VNRARASAEQAKTGWEPSPGARNGSEPRAGVSILVIGALSALSWVIVITAIWLIWASLKSAWILGNI
jgi:hypothetical protein